MRTEPGISEGCTVYYDMPFEDYCQLPGINASALKGVGGTSPKHLKAVIDRKIVNKDSDDKKFGRAAHCILLEPERFSDAFPVADFCSATKADGDKCGNTPSMRLLDGSWRCGVHKELTMVDPDDKRKKILIETAAPVADYVTVPELERLHGLRNALKVSNVQDFLRRPGYSEMVITWEQFGFPLKTRLDKASIEIGRLTGLPEAATVIDLKKCQVGAANFEDAQKACVDYQYHIQSWFHIAAVQAAFGLGLDAIEAFFIFIEDNHPYDTHLLKVDSFDPHGGPDGTGGLGVDLDIATKNVMNQLIRYRACEKKGVFDGTQPVIVPGKAGITPAWFVKQHYRGT